MRNGVGSKTLVANLGLGEWQLSKRKVTSRYDRGQNDEIPGWACCAITTSLSVANGSRLVPKAGSHTCLQYKRVIYGSAMDNWMEKINLGCSDLMLDLTERDRPTHQRKTRFVAPKGTWKLTILS
jgi:hypothetical protein